jgi:hypothetical protein
LQQRTLEATVVDLIRANWVLRQAQEMSRNLAERRRYRDPNFDMKTLSIIMGHDASFAEQP